MRSMTLWTDIALGAAVGEEEGKGAAPAMAAAPSTTAAASADDGCAKREYGTTSFPFAETTTSAPFRFDGRAPFTAASPRRSLEYFRLS